MNCPKNCSRCSSHVGSGIYTDVKEKVEEVKQKFEKRIKSRPKSIDKFMNDKRKIVAIDICRTPISRVVNKVLKAVHKKKYEQYMKKYSYDDMFHLHMNLIFDDGSVKTTEKNQIPTLHSSKKPNQKNTKCIARVSTPNKMTFGEMILKAEAVYPNLYFYSVVKDNCQRYVKTLANILGVKQHDKFILQYNPREIMGKTTKGFIDFVTVLANTIDRYILGSGEHELSAEID